MLPNSQAPARTEPLVAVPETSKRIVEKTSIYCAAGGAPPAAAARCASVRATWLFIRLDLEEGSATGRRLCGSTYIKLRLMNETTSIKAQFGTPLRGQRT